MQRQREQYTVYLLHYREAILTNPLNLTVYGENVSNETDILNQRLSHKIVI